jgi:hypothetical protein
LPEIGVDTRETDNESPIHNYIDPTLDLIEELKFLPFSDVEKSRIFKLKMIKKHRDRRNYNHSQTQNKSSILQNTRNLRGSLGADDS